MTIFGVKSQSVKLMQAIDNNIAYFDKRNKSLSHKLSQLNVATEKCVKAAADIETFSSIYDFDDRTPANGYRSFLSIVGSAIKKSDNLLEQLINARETFFFRADNYSKYKVEICFAKAALSLIVSYCFQRYRRLD